MWDKIIESLQKRWEACYYLFADARVVRAHQAFLNNDEDYRAKIRPRLARKASMTLPESSSSPNTLSSSLKGLSSSFYRIRRTTVLKWSGTSQ